MVVEGGHLFGKWKEYSWYQVDISEIDEFNLTDEHGRSLSVPLTSYNASSIALIGGRLMSGRSIFSYRPKTEDLKVFVFPFNNGAELSLMRISLLTDEGHSVQMSKHYQVSDLMGCSRITLLKKVVSIFL